MWMKPISAVEVRAAMNVSTGLIAETELTVDQRSAILCGLDNASVMENIHSFVSNGGLLSEWCEMHQFDFYRVFGWIRTDSARMKLYEQADSIHIHAAKNKILREIKAIGGANIAEAYNADGTMKHVKDMPLHLQRAIVSMKSGITNDGQAWSELKTADKLKALELYGKTLALFVDHKVPEIGATLEDLVLKSFERGQQNERERSGIGTGSPGTGTNSQGVRAGTDGDTRGQDPGFGSDPKL